MTDDQAVPLPPDAIKAAAEAIHDVEMRPEPGKPCWCSEAVEHEDEMRMAYLRAEPALTAAADFLRAQGAATERERIRDWLRDDVAKRATWFSDRYAALAVADLLDGTP